MGSRRLLLISLALVVGASLFVAGWFSSRYYYTSEQRRLLSKTQGGQCHSSDEQLSIPTPSRQIILPCTASLEEVVEIMGEPDDHTTMQTRGQHYDLLSYTWKTGEPVGVVAQVLFIDSKLESAMTTEDDLSKYQRRRRPRKE